MNDECKRNIYWIQGERSIRRISRCVCGWVLTPKCIEQLAAMLLKFFHTFIRINDIWKCKVHRTKTTRTFQITFSIANTRQHTNTSFLRESEFLSCLHFWNCRLFVDRSLICKLLFRFLFPMLYLIVVPLPCGKIYCVFYFYSNFHSVGIFIIYSPIEFKVKHIHLTDMQIFNTQTMYRMCIVPCWWIRENLRGKAIEIRKEFYAEGNIESFSGDRNRYNTFVWRTGL